MVYFSNGKHFSTFFCEKIHFCAFCASFCQKYASGGMDGRINGLPSLRRCSAAMGLFLCGEVVGVVFLEDAADGLPDAEVGILVEIGE